MAEFKMENKRNQEKNIESCFISRWNGNENKMNVHNYVAEPWKVWN